MSSSETNPGSMLSSSDQILDHNVEERALTHMAQMITIYSLPLVLKTAVELDLLGIIARAGPDRQLSAAEIVVHLPTANPEAATVVDRMLQLLATHSVVTCSVAPGDQTRRYGLTQVSRYLVPDEDGLSLVSYLHLKQHKFYLDSWSKLKDAALEGGIPFNKVHGTGFFECAASNPMFGDLFNKAMFNYSMMVTKKILEKYKGFEHVKQLVDVGGGLGHVVHAIVSKYPSIKGINFDLPHVIEHAVAYPGVEHVSGDMFVSVPQGDTILLKWVIHDWSNDHCVKLLKNCHAALPKNGKVIIVEEIKPDASDNSVEAKGVSQMDMFMLILTKGGRERTREEFVMLANEAGFSHIKFDSSICNFWIIELYK